ncbi:MAG: anthranilate synthase component I [bacterium]
MFPDIKEYERLAGDYNLIPVYGETLADSETPVSVLARFAANTNVFLLESMEGGETWGRYSFVGVDPQLLLEADHSAGRTGSLDGLRDVYKGVRVAPVAGLPRFCGGAVGFIGYEGICEFERMPAPRQSQAGARPCSRFLKADCIIVFDNVRHTLKVVVSSRPNDSASPAEAYRAAVARIEAVEEILRRPAPRQDDTVVDHAEFSCNMSKEQFCSMVTAAKKYIVAGDVIQVVLSQKFSAQSQVKPFQAYRALRLLNPSPYTFFLKIGDQTLVGSSPEVMVRLTGNRVELRPIAGTRPRGSNEQEDRRLADELLSDEKEKAEHVMLVDLGRNDVGRIAVPGSVQVREYMVIERYSHVMHLVSHVEGLLRKEFDACDVIRASFPAGTLSGAPKIRAMEIIRELEPEPRGIYGGAVGYIGYDGNIDLAITIRTLEMRKGQVAVQAGAGVVYDSDPVKEFEETHHKARGMQRAVRIAENGLRLDSD